MVGRRRTPVLAREALREAPTPGARVDRDGARTNAVPPLYEQLQQALTEQIVSGRIKPGDRLPSEREILAQFGVSRVTARRALTALAHSDLIRASPGRGWFVADELLSEPPNTLLSFTAMARRRGLHPTARVLTRSVRSATIDEAELLQIAPGVDVFELERVRLLDGMPVAVDRCIVPLARCPELIDVDFSTASLYAMLTEYAHLRPTRADCTLEAAPAGDKIAPLIGVDPSFPVLVARQVTHDQRGTPIESSCVTYRSDRYRFRTKLELSSQ